MSLSVASSGDVIASSADPTQPTAATTSAATSAVPANLQSSDASSSSTPVAEPRDLPGAHWRAEGQLQGPAFIRILQENEFQPDVVGAKACNLAKLRSRLPEWIMVPKSVALPLGTFEAVLADPANAEVAAEIAQIEQQLQLVAEKGSALGGNGASSNGSSSSSNGSGEVAASPTALLARARELVETKLLPPAGMQQVRVSACAIA